MTQDHAHDENKPANPARVQELERKIAELKNSWPAHSIPAAMLQQLEDLEEELENERHWSR